MNHEGSVTSMPILAFLPAAPFVADERRTTPLEALRACDVDR